MSMSTPWGTAQEVRRFAPGFVSVSTAGHGGLMLSPIFATRLSAAARARAEVYKGYLCYEEDCACAIAEWELPAFWPVIYATAPADIVGDIRGYLRRVLSGHSPDYLLAIGEEPDPEPYARHLAGVERDRRTAAHDPDVIVAARGDWHTGIPGVLEVTTADDRTHLVTSASYDATQPDYPLRLLSACERYPSREAQAAEEDAQAVRNVAELFAPADRPRIADALEADGYPDQAAIWRATIPVLTAPPTNAQLAMFADELGAMFGGSL